MACHVPNFGTLKYILSTIKESNLKLNFHQLKVICMLIVTVKKKLSDRHGWIFSTPTNKTRLFLPQSFLAIGWSARRNK